MKKISNWAEFPFAPAGSPIFYGWVIVIVATIGKIASIPGQTIGVGVFTDSLVVALELSRTQLSLAYMFGTVTSSFLLPFAGGLTDRIGTRAMVVYSSLGLGVSLFLFSNAQVIPQLAGTPAAAIAMIALGFLLIRFFGQGCLTMVSRITIAKWFNHRRGLAAGIGSVLVAFSFNASPFLLNGFVERLGWENTYLVLAILIGVGMTAFGWFFYRDNPEQCGLKMDGKEDVEWVKKVTARIPDVLKQFTLGQAARTFPFWIFAVGMAWQALFMTAVTFHITSMGRQFDMDRGESFALFPLIGIVSVGATVVAGWISDRVCLKWLLLALILSQALAGFGLFDLGNAYGKGLFVFGYAISAGLFSLLMTIAWPRFFGRDHLGAIAGMMSSIQVFASAIGPFLFGSIYEWTGSYNLILYFCVILPGLLLGPALFIENPQTKIRRLEEMKRILTLEQV